MALSNVELLALEKQKKAQELKGEEAMFSYDKLMEMTSYQKDMLIVLHRTVAKGTTPAEFAFFLTYCKSSGLNPINKEIWCYKNTQGDVLIFTGRDGFLKKNKENPMYRGMRSSEVCEFDEFEIDMIEGKVKHIITNNRGKVISAYAIVSIEGQKDVVVYLDFDEFNLNQAKWKTAPKMMIKKCAQSHALREAAGMTGIQPEESFVVKNDLAYSLEEGKSKYPESEDKEAERILVLIEGAKDREGLKKLLDHCTTTESKLAYDKKYAELEK